MTMRSGSSASPNISFEVIPSSAPRRSGTNGRAPVAISRCFAEYSAPVASRTQCASVTVARARNNSTPTRFSVSW